MTTQKKSIVDISVGEIMTPRVEVLSPVDSIQDAVKMMLDSEVTTVPIVDGNNRCIGVLSRSDLTEMFLQEDNELSHALDTDRLSVEWLNRSLDTSDSRLVKELMTHEVVTVKLDSTITEASREMVTNHIHHLPVVDEDQAVIGIVSTFDIVRAVAEC